MLQHNIIAVFVLPWQNLKLKRVLPWQNLKLKLVGAKLSAGLSAARRKIIFCDLCTIFPRVTRLWEKSRT
jgi:hypothetical protein